MRDYMMNDKIKVLDHGYLEYIDHMGSDLTICQSARVSFDKDTTWEEYDCKTEPIQYEDGSYSRELVTTCKQRLREGDKKLIHYLSKNNHWTPFAHPQITLRVKAPVSIRTQLFKHKISLVENEVSRRYVELEPEFYYPRWRSRPTGGAKQGSGDWLEDNEVGGETSGGFSTHPLYRSYDYQMKASLNLYEELITSGVAPEQARFVLPQSMYTEWYWTGSLAAFSRVYKLRIEKRSQWETRQYAKAIGDTIRPLFPISWPELTGDNNETNSSRE